MRTRETEWLFLAVVVLFLSACQSMMPPPPREAGHAPNISLEKTGWVLSTLEGGKPLSDTTITLRFAADGVASGSNGCNNYRGSYSTEGATLRFPGDFAATLMACPDSAMTQADTFMQALKQTVAFRADDEQLRLLDVSGTELATFAAQDDQVTGTPWKVRAYNNGRQAVVSLITGTEITARFGEDGRVTGSAGCNAYFAPYKLDGESIEIGPAGATRRFCAEPQGVMEQENRYLEALQSAATFRISGNKLELRTADGALAMTLVP